MRNIFVFAFILASFCAIGQSGSIVKTAAINYSAGAPAWTPNATTASELAFDTTGKRFYFWNRKSRTWDLQGRFIDEVSGSSAPAYTPSQTDSWVAVNNANPPEIYVWSGSSWVKAGGVTYTAGTGIAISGSNVISNTGDLSSTNELQNLSLTGQSLGISSGTGVTLPIIDVVAGTGVTVSKASGAATVNSSGITALTGDVTASGPGSAAATIANGVITGAKLATGAVSDSTKIAANVIEQSNIDNGAVWARHIARMGASTGQVLGWNGSIWGPTAAGISGSGVSGRVAYWNGTNTQTSSSNLFWDNTNNRFSLGTISPTHQFTILNNTNSSSVRITPSLGNGGGFFIRSGAQSDGEFTAGYEVVNAVKIARSTFAAGINFYNGGSYFINRSGLADGSSFNNDWSALLSSSGNFGIGTNINPAARLHVVGSGITSATWGLQVQNNAGNNALMVRDDGNVGVGTNAPGAKLHIQASAATDVGLIVRGAAGHTASLAQFQNSAGTALAFVTSNGSLVVPNSGDVSWNTFSKISSAANGNLTLYNNTYNGFGMLQFGGTGVTVPAIKRQANNTLQIISSDDATAASFLVTGDVRIGTTIAVATAALDVTSTTKGFLPPRMTAVQASAISSPAEGLMIYVTTTNATFLTKGWYGYNGAAWEKLNN